jgi:selenide,water dikinase
LDSPDDAAIWRLDEERSLVVTTDFFTPVVDDPYDYGAIAAANALSDVYAMGGKPFLALSIAALPPNLPIEISMEIIRGGAEKVKEAGAVIAGGHTIQDKEPKFGLVVLGMVPTRQVLTKGGLQPGDQLILTKPLGFGVTTTALKEQLAETEDVHEVVEWMKRLNRDAAQLAQAFDVRSMTDVTGFSLLGHAREMAEASNMGMHLKFLQIPFVSCASKYGSHWTFPGGAIDNRHHFERFVDLDSTLEEYEQMLLFDPQTSGGLLMGLKADRLGDFLMEAKRIHQPAWVIGEVTNGDTIRVTRS